MQQCGYPVDKFLFHIVKHLGEGIGSKPRKKKRAKFKLFRKNVKQIKCDTLSQGPSGWNENKTRTPIFLEMTKRPPPTQKNPGSRLIYKAPQKILANF